MSYILVSFMGAMMLAPLSLRVAERAGITIGLHQIAAVAFSWMGLLYIFIALFAAVDGIRLFLAVVSTRFSLSYTLLRTGTTRFFYGIILLTLTLFVYGLTEASSPRIEYVELRSAKIPPAIGRLRIVQLSDVHLGLLVDEKLLEKILALVRETAPDLLVSTGDLVDGQPNDLHKASSLLATINPPLGKIAVTGNHEFYAGIENSVAFTHAAGFTLLRQQVVDFDSFLVVGVDDKAIQHGNNIMPVKEHDLLEPLPQDTFVLLLKHRPDISPESIGHFDLQLSGHTHKGQIFPFNVITWFFYPYPSGRLTSLAKGYLYLNRGTATWGPPIRIGAPPEVTVIDIYPEKTLK